MSKKDRKIAELEAEIKAVRVKDCNDFILQIVRHCKSIEDAVNHPDFTPGSLKLTPRTSKAPSIMEIASTVEILITTEHGPAKDNLLKDHDKLWKYNCQPLADIRSMQYFELKDDGKYKMREVPMSKGDFILIPITSDFEISSKASSKGKSFRVKKIK